VSSFIPCVILFLTGTPSIFFLLIFAMTLIMKIWFRALAASFSDPAPAQSTAGIVLLALVLYAGYNIPKPSMIGALRWISYLNVSVNLSADDLQSIDGLFHSLCDMDMSLS
jgi:ABC-2 type transporter